MNDWNKSFSFYHHNGDHDLAEKLGLNTPSNWESQEGGWLFLGTVTGPEHDLSAEEQVKRYGAASPGPWTVEVSVYSAPAQFYRFEIRRHDEKIVDDDSERGWHVEYEPKTIVLKTGSGGLGTYWPTAEGFAQNMLTVEVTDGVLA